MTVPSTLDAAGWLRNQLESDDGDQDVWDIDSATASLNSILDAAESCFRRYGIRRTSMEDVADAADVSRNALYRAVGNRESLLLRIAVRRAERFSVVVRARIATCSTIEEAISEFVVLAVKAGRTEPIFNLFVRPFDNDRGMSDEAEARRAAIDITAKMWQLIVERFESSIPPSEYEDVAVWLYSVIHSMWALGEHYGTDERVRRLVTRYLSPLLG